MATQQAQQKPITLDGKLLEIQKSNKSFINTEGSEKKTPGTNKDAYNYTPGWQIVQSIREDMDRLGVSLLSNIKEEKHELISYPVWKLINSVPQKFEKTEIYVTITVEYTWKDRETGETEGPWTQIAAGSNGTDKSISSAIALAERYFLLKYFHIATKDKSDEPDEHDSQDLLGLMTSQQPMSATIEQAVRQPQPQYAPQQMQYAPQPQMNPVQPQWGQMQPQQAPAQTAPPSYTNSPYQATPPNDTTPYASRLAYFQKGTDAFKRTLTEIIQEMDGAIFPKNDPMFIAKLIKQSDDIRTNSQQGMNIPMQPRQYTPTT